MWNRFNCRFYNTVINRYSRIRSTAVSTTVSAVIRTNNNNNITISKLFNTTATATINTDTNTNINNNTNQSTANTTLIETTNRYFSPIFISNNNNITVAIALSGGVDSSVSAYLLKSAGYNVIGVYMNNWDSTNEYGYCTNSVDYSDCINISKSLSIELLEVNFQREYWTLVFEQLLSGYSAGLTPNPDTYCNREIKFNLLLQYCLSANSKYNIQYLATGHYARTNSKQQIQLELEQQKYYNNHTINSSNNTDNNNLNTVIDKLSDHLNHIHYNNNNNNNPSKSNPIGLYCATDPRKDQSYFLSLIRPGSLNNLLFPVGLLNKSQQVRSIAIEANLLTATKPDSMGICFIGKRKFNEFLSEYIPMRTGNFITLDNLIVGSHSGIESYTIGQRTHIGGMSTKWYIAEKRLLSNELVVVNSQYHTALLHDQLYIKSNTINWIKGLAPIELIINKQLIIDSQLQSNITGNIIELKSSRFHCEAKLRSTEIRRRIEIQFIINIKPNNTSTNDGEYIVSFPDSPHHQISPGQVIVFYSGIECLGGGIIDRTDDSYYYRGKILTQEQQQKMNNIRTIQDIN